MISIPILALPGPSKTFLIKTDACRYGIGIVLMQEGHHMEWAHIGVSIGLVVAIPYKSKIFLIYLD